MDNPIIFQSLRPFCKRGKTSDPLDIEVGGYYVDGGATLRDYFAAFALQGLLGSEIYMKEIDDTCKKLNATGDEEKIAAAKVVTKTAFFIADEMLLQRSTK